MVKKIISAILISALCLSAVSCGDSSQTASDPSKTTITIAARDGSHADVINAVKESFEKANNCSVNVIPLSGDDIHSNIIADSANETGEYDVIMIDDPLMPEYIEKRILRNLTQMGYTDDEDFVEKSRLLGKDPYPLGATYALPFSGNVQLIFYNSSLVGQNTDFTNWDSILQTAKAVNASGKNGYAIRGQTGNPIVSDFLPILWAFGGDLFNSSQKVVLNSPESRAALEFYCELYKTGENYEKDELINAVTSGEAAIALGWPSWFISGSGSSAELAQIPGKINASSEMLPTGEIGNWLLGVTSNSANAELSLEFIKYLTSKDVQLEALKHGGIPTRTSVFKDSNVLAEYPHFDAIYKGSNNSRVRPRTTKWSRIEEVFGAELVKCINGEQSVETTIEKSQAAIEALASE